MSKIILVLGLLSLIAAAQAKLPLYNLESIDTAPEKPRGMIRRSIESEESNEDTEVEAAEDNNSIEARAVTPRPFKPLIIGNMKVSRDMPRNNRVSRSVESEESIEAYANDEEAAPEDNGVAPRSEYTIN